MAHLRLIVLFCLLTSTAQAQTVRATITWTAGPNGVSYQTAKEMGVWLSEQYKIDFGVNLIVRPRAMRDIAARYRGLDLNSRILRLFRWQQFFGRQGTSKEIIQLVVTPPMFDGKTYWIAGLASGQCTLRKERGIATADAEYVNSSGLPRLIESKWGLYHESAHLLGASHIESWPPTLMHPAAPTYLAQYGYVLPIDKKTEQQIWKCVH